MRNLKYTLLFIFIQIVQLPPLILGIPLVAVALWLGRYQFFVNIRQWHFKDKLMWLFDNDNDGIVAPWHVPTKWNIWVWSALRNPVNNFNHVRGVSKIGRPLFYRPFTVKGKPYYFKAGWDGRGYPVLSGGSGKW